MEENKKGAFISKVEDYAKEMSKMASEKREGVKRGLIVLAAEELKGEDGTKTIISIGGNEGNLSELVAQFVMNDETSRFVSQGLKLCVLKTFIEKIEEGFND